MAPEFQSELSDLVSLYLFVFKLLGGSRYIHKVWGVLLVQNIENNSLVWSM